MPLQAVVVFASLLLLIVPSSRAEEKLLVDSTLETVLAKDAKRVIRTGKWRVDRFRFGFASHLQTYEDNATLEYSFDGTGVAVRLGGHDVPAYYPASLGTLAVTIDDGPAKRLTPHGLPREVVLADGLDAGVHSLRIEHLAEGDRAGCRIESFQTWNDVRGELQFHVSGRRNAFLVDCRIVLRRGQAIVRNTIARNWMTGQCSLTGLLPGDGYSLEVQAIGWQTFQTPKFSVSSSGPTMIPPIYLLRDEATVIHRFLFPRINQPAIRKPGQTFRARFEGFQAKIDEVRLTRQVGPAIISRVVEFQEDKSAAYYYDREISVTLPNDMPPGAYDLSVKVVGNGRSGVCRSPRSVHVLQRDSTDPVIATFGHLDVFGQFQAEYLQRLVSALNLLAPDVVLCSTAVNPAYLSGALADLEMPYLINFGNHQFPGHEQWYGDSVGLVDVGSNISILNFGHQWHTDISMADALLASRPKTAMKLINAFEPNAPLDFLDRHQVRMIHFAHGPGSKNQDVGATPTRRLGKQNSESFRMVRFRENRVVSCTYNEHKNAAIPFPRSKPSPVFATYSQLNDGTSEANTATITNRLLEAFPNGRVTFVVPSGSYRVTGGRFESEVTSDDGRYAVISVRMDIPASGDVQVAVERL